MRVCQHCKTENNEVTSRCWGCYEPVESPSPLDATTCSISETLKLTNMDLLEECAREKVGMGPDWKAFRIECLPKHPQPTELVSVRGAVVPLVTRGKRTGRPNWDKMDKSTLRTAYVTLKEHAEWVIQWEKRTGKCSRCEGSGQEFAGCSVERGSWTRPCGKCGATGKSNDPKTMKTTTIEEMMATYDHATLAKRVIELELAFAKLMDTPCSGSQIEIIKDAFPRPPIGHAWSRGLNDERIHGDAGAGKPIETLTPLDDAACSPNP